MLKNVTLYAKGKYHKSGDIWADVKKCLEGDDYTPETKVDILSIIIAQMSRICFKDKGIDTIMLEVYNSIRPEQTNIETGYTHRQSKYLIQRNDSIVNYDVNEAILWYYLTKIRFLTVSDIGGLPAPDPNVLPLKNMEENLEVK